MDKVTQVKTHLRLELFTFFGEILISMLVFMLPTEKLSKIAYVFSYYIFAIYAVIQYGYYLIFGKFIFFNDFLLAGEELS